MRPFLVRTLATLLCTVSGVASGAAAALLHPTSEECEAINAKAGDSAQPPLTTPEKVLLAKCQDSKERDAGGGKSIPYYETYGPRPVGQLPGQI